MTNYNKLKITKDNIIKTAQLARIALNEEEIEKMSKELTTILDCFNKISKLNTENIEPTTHILDIKNSNREDEIKKSLDINEAIKNAPKKSNTFIVVPKII